MAHDILPKTIDAMLHVQLLDTWRHFLHLLVVALLLTHSGSRDDRVHGRRNMRADSIVAMQSVEDFWPGAVSRFEIEDWKTALTQRSTGLNVTTA
jgi:hypothetical protein